MRVKWTKELASGEARKYETRAEFQYGSHKAYDAAHRHGWLEDVCSHMMVLRENWTRDKIQDQANKYIVRVDFKRGSPRAYGIARHRGILDEVCAHMVSGKCGRSRRSWIAKGERDSSLAKVYLIKVYDEIEEFYKVGITYATIKGRYASSPIPYSYDIIRQVEGEPKTIWDTEDRIKQFIKKEQRYLYKPLQAFKGRSECFKEDAISKIVEILEDLV